MIQIRHLTKWYGPRAAVSDVSLQVHPGEVTLLLGANGAGKSTLLRCLLGITSFDGEVEVAGLDPLAQGRAVRAEIGYMPQSGGLHLDLTVKETMDLYAAIRRVAPGRGDGLLDEAGLADHVMTKVGELSGGMRQRLGFALALLADPRILVLDEPSASLDAASRKWLAAKLRAAASGGRTVLVSTHPGPELLAAADRRILIEDGRIVSDEQNGMPGRPGATDQQGRARSGSLLPLALKEIKDAIRNRWLISYAALLGLLGTAAAVTGIEGSSGLALQAFGRTTATLMNLCLLLAPLVAVLMGASSIASERDRGTLDHLLAQPLNRASVLLVKHASLLVSLTAATFIGFVPAGWLIAWHGGAGSLAHYLLFPAIASVAGAAMLAVGMFISVSSRTAVQSQGAAVFAWFGFVLLYDLVLMGALAMSGLPVEVLGAALIANPVDAARVLAVLTLEPDLYLLGPAGAYLTARFSRAGTAFLLLAALSGWAVLPMIAALIRFSDPRRRGINALRRLRSHGRQTTGFHRGARDARRGVRMLAE